MRIIKPKPLKPGSTLGIVACSAPIHESSRDTIERAYQRLRDRGFRLVEAPNCRKITGHTAGTVKERVQTLHRFFSDPSIDGILNYWGGHQSHQLLEYLDFALIRRNPKPFIGFSDTTALQMGILVKAGLVTFSAPAGITFGKPIFPDFTWEHFERVLVRPEAPLKLVPSQKFSDNPWYTTTNEKMIFHRNPGWKVYRKGKAQGRVLGGNIGTMLLLAGTPYWPKSFKGKILFVEDDEGESPKTVDRYFTQLRQMGVYEKLAGMVIGRFSRSVGFTKKDSLECILREALRGYQFPVITGVDFGHTDPLITIPLGIRCRINALRPEIVFLEKAVES